MTGALHSDLAGAGTGTAGGVAIHGGAAGTITDLSLRDGRTLLARQGMSMPEPDGPDARQPAHARSLVPIPGPVLLVATILARDE